MTYVLAYLAAIVAANLTLAAIIDAGGSPYWSVVTALLFIGADLTLRDRLTDRWRGRAMVPRMGALIVAGSVLSYLLNADARTIAVASAVAWSASALVDWIVYVVLGSRPWMVRTTGSNVPAAAVDSYLFPTLAFGAVIWPLVLAQFGAKVVGGLVWAWLLRGRRAAARG